MWSLKPLLAATLLGLLAAVFVVSGMPLPAAADVDPAAVAVRPSAAMAEHAQAAGITTTYSPKADRTGGDEPGTGTGPAEQGAGTKTGLRRTGPDGLGTVLFAGLGITGLALVCLVVAFRISRREREE